MKNTSLIFSVFGLQGCGGIDMGIKSTEAKKEVSTGADEVGPDDGNTS